MIDSHAFITGFVIACVDLAREHGHDDLAYLLLEGAGITREQAIAATDAYDHETIATIFALAAD